MACENEKNSGVLCPFSLLTQLGFRSHALRFYITSELLEDLLETNSEVSTVEVFVGESTAVESSTLARGLTSLLPTSSWRMRKQRERTEGRVGPCKLTVGDAVRRLLRLDPGGGVVDLGDGGKT